MDKKVKNQVSEIEKVKDENEVSVGEIHLLIYQESENEERILSSYIYKRDISFLIDKFMKDEKLREKYKVVNAENLKMITTTMEHNFGLELPSAEIRKEELEKLFSDLEKETSKMEKLNETKVK
tara:strand:- start:371 stop:742 length:372 start_codon:yes stop_codon:yes gene_type:complete